MINCAIYPRKSKAVDNSDSMDVQIDMCRRYLDDKYGSGNYTATVYDGDYGITGHSTKKRKDFQRMMRDVSDRKIQLVVIQRYDRIARNTRDFCNLYHDMEINGCNLVSVSQQIDTTTPYGKNFMYMQASMAELEWALNSERRKDTIRYAASIGKSILPDHSTPFGYHNSVVNGVRRLVKEEQWEDAVADLFEYYRKYRNYSATARHINQQYGTRFEIQAIKRIIRSPFYYGCYKDNDNFCEPYISKEDWHDLQQKRPVIRTAGNKRTEVLFSGMIRCPDCNRLMRSCQKSHRSGNVYRYYHCEYHSTKMCGFAKVKSENLIEEMLLNRVDTFLAEREADMSDQKSEKKHLTNNVSKYLAELDRLNTMFLKGRISEEYYDTEYLRLNDLIWQYEASRQSHDSVKHLQEVFVSDWKEIYKDLDKLHRKFFWRDVIRQIIVDDNMNVIDVIFL
jgi:DNA invertase Pin-like site-specific DNA recombinase|nr:MAG TPA: integrase [Caudoviricetes sp.]